MVDENVMYILNDNLEVVESQDKTCLLPEELTKVFLLNTIELEIWHIFSKPINTNDAYVEFNRTNTLVEIEYQDFVNFIEQLVDNELLIEAIE